MQENELATVIEPIIGPTVILVNGRKREWAEKEISFRQVVELAYGKFDENPEVGYTVTYSSGPRPRPQGILVDGESVEVYEGMNFNVGRTNRS
jgi:Multiubiquitin